MGEGGEGEREGGREGMRGEKEWEGRKGEGGRERW